MSFTPTTMTSIGPRLCRRQTTIGLGAPPPLRSSSPGRHMRFMSACIAQADAVLRGDPSPVDHMVSTTNTRKRSASASWRPMLQGTPIASGSSSSPASRNATPLPSPFLQTPPNRSCTPFLTDSPRFSPHSPLASSYFALPLPASSPLAPPTESPTGIKATATSTTTSSSGMRTTTIASAPPPPVPNVMPLTLAGVARSAPVHERPAMMLQSSKFTHSLSVDLPDYTPDEVTISVTRYDMLKVVADRWASEDKCHYEWVISFSPDDVSMGAVHARFNKGKLTITVPRIQVNDHTLPPTSHMAMRLV